MFTYIFFLFAIIISYICLLTDYPHIPLVYSDHIFFNFVHFLFVHIGAFSPSTPPVDVVNPLPTVLLWSYLADTAMLCGAISIGSCILLLLLLLLLILSLLLLLLLLISLLLLLVLVLVLLLLLFLISLLLLL